MYGTQNPNIKKTLFKTHYLLYDILQTFQVTLIFCNTSVCGLGRISVGKRYPGGRPGQQWCSSCRSVTSQAREWEDLAQ